jgi:hypothetical protein
MAHILITIRVFLKPDFTHFQANPDLRLKYSTIKEIIRDFLISPINKRDCPK